MCFVFNAIAVYLFAVDGYYALISQLENVVKQISSAEAYITQLESDIMYQLGAAQSGNRLQMAATVQIGAIDTQLGANAVKSNAALYNLANVTAPQRLEQLAIAFIAGIANATTENNLMNTFANEVLQALANGDDNTDNYYPLMNSLKGVAKAIPGSAQYINTLITCITNQLTAAQSGDKQQMAATVRTGAQATKAGANTVSSNIFLYILGSIVAPAQLNNLADGLIKGSKTARDENNLMGEFNRLVALGLKYCK